MRTIAANLMIYSTLLLIHSDASGQSGSWQLLGKGEVVQATSLCYSRTGGLFAGTSGRVCRSTDMGTTWSNFSPAIPAANAASLAADSSGVLYAFGEGIWRSTDDGMNWEKVISGDTTVLSFAAGREAVYAGTSYCGILASTDHGTSWTVLPSRHDSSISLFAALNGFIFETCIDTPSSGINRSTDGGKTWELVYSEAGGAYCPMQTSSGRMLAGSASGIITSTDSGATWNLLSSNPIDPSAVTAILEGIGGGLIGRTGSARLIFSLNDGITWWPQPIADTTLDVGPLTKDSEGRLYAGTEVGVYASDNGGEGWYACDGGFWHAEVQCFGIAQGGYIYAGTNVGLFRSTDDGDSWKKIKFPPPSSLGRVYNFQNILVGKDRIIYARNALSGVYRTIDSGNTWTITSVADTMISRLQLDTAGNLIACSWFMILRSTDRGDTWKVFGSFPNYSYVTDLIVNGHNEAFAATYSEGLFHSTDGGAGWAYCGLKPTVIHCLLQTPKGTVLAGSQGNGVYRSTDDGSSWQQRSVGIGDNNSFLSLTSTTGGTIYGGKYDGVWYSTDEGDTWYPDTTGMGTVAIRALIEDSRGDVIAGTSQGAYRMTPTVGVRDPHPALPVTFRLDQNFPNPFNPSTTIRYGLSARSHVDLTVFNTLGQKVATLVQGDQEAGYHEVRFDGTGLASGVYFLKLTAERFSAISKMVLMK